MQWILKAMSDPDEPPIKKYMQDSKPSPNKTARISCLRWWLPELFASLLAVASLVSLAIFVRQYHGRSLQELKVDLPSWLTFNTLIATLSALTRVALMVPIESAMSQKVWLWLSESRSASKRRGQLRDLELSDAASRGSWGSLLLLLKAEKR